MKLVHKRNIFLCLCLVLFLCSCASKANQSKNNSAKVTPEENTGSMKTENTKENKEAPVDKPKDEPPPVAAIKEIQGLVKVSDIDSSIIIDLKYATTDNFTHKKVYPAAICVLQKETALKLKAANDEFKTMGYSIKVWDAYRPLDVQKIFWNLVPDSRFVANPNNGGSRHNHGTAVDITLVDKNGNELVMPSKFDDFTSNAFRNNPKMSKEAKNNMNLLTNVMKKHGFITINTEWWHYEDSDYSKYPLMNVALQEFQN